MKRKVTIVGGAALIVALSLCESWLDRSNTQSAYQSSEYNLSHSSEILSPTRKEKRREGSAPAERTTPASRAIGTSRYAHALAEISDPEDSEQESGTLDRLADSVPLSEFRNAVQELSVAEAGSPGAVLRERLLTRWTRLAPEQAAAWVVTSTEPAARKEGLLQVAVTWAESDLSAAVAWARTLSNASERDGLLVQLAHETVREDPVRALEIAAELPPDASRDELLGQAVGNWATRDPQAAAQWARAVSAEAGSIRVIESVAISWAGIDAAAAIKFALENLPPGAALDRVAVAIVQRWTQSDPWAASGWIRQFEPGALQQTAIENLMANWCARDFEEPATWIATLQAGAVRDQSIANYARQLASVEPWVATAWCGQIADSTIRGQVEKAVAVFDPRGR